MARPNFRSKVLCICVFLIGLFAYAGVAQAETGAFWLVNGAKTASESAVEGETDVKTVFLTELGGKIIHIVCLGISFREVHLFPAFRILGRLIFILCLFYSLKTAGGEMVLQKACEPSAEGVKGLIVTNSITGLIVLHEPKAGTKEGVLELKPTTAGGQLATINLGPECAFGETLKLGGVLFLKDSNGQFSTNVVQHLLAELPALTKLTVNEGSKAATMDGSFWAFLGGAQKGLTWSGIPG
jgi:hypothetical protein